MVGQALDETLIGGTGGGEVPTVAIIATSPPQLAFPQLSEEAHAQLIDILSKKETLGVYDPLEELKKQQEKISEAAAKPSLGMWTAPADQAQDAQVDSSGIKTTQADLRDPESLHNINEAKKAQLASLTTAMPVNEVDGKAFREYVAPILTSSANADPGTVDKALATVSTAFDDTPGGMTGRVSTAPAINLEKMEAKLEGLNFGDLKGLAMISEVRNLPPDFGASDISAHSVTGEAGRNMNEHIQNRAAEQADMAAHLSSLANA